MLTWNVGNIANLQISPDFQAHQKKNLERLYNWVVVVVVVVVVHGVRDKNKHVCNGLVLCPVTLVDQITQQ